MKTSFLIIIILLVGCVPNAGKTIEPQPVRNIINSIETKLACSEAYIDCLEWTGQQGLEFDLFEKAIQECINEVGECYG